MRLLLMNVLQQLPEEKANAQMRGVLCSGVWRLPGFEQREMCRL